MKLLGPAVPASVEALGHCWATADCVAPVVADIVTVIPAGVAYGDNGKPWRSSTPVCATHVLEYLGKLLAGDPLVSAIRNRTQLPED